MMMHPPFSSVISLDDGSTSSCTKNGFRKIAPTAISWLLYEWVKGDDFPIGKITLRTLKKGEAPGFRGGSGNGGAGNSRLDQFSA